MLSHQFSLMLFQQLQGVDPQLQPETRKPQSSYELLTSRVFLLSEVNRLPDFLSCTSLSGLSAFWQAKMRQICFTVLQSVTPQKDRHPLTRCPALMAFFAASYL